MGKDRVKTHDVDVRHAEENEASRENLSLWLRNRATDADYVKQVSIGYKFNSPDPQYQLMLATAEWGPYGGKWGLEELSWSITETGGKASLILIATFYAPGSRFPIANDMLWTPNQQCHKKLLTNTRSKALSMLGFNADVFLGAWDDEMYVAEAEKQKDVEGVVRAAQKAIADCTDIGALAKLKDRVAERFDGRLITRPHRDDLYQQIESKWAELDEKKVTQDTEAGQGGPASA